MAITNQRINNIREKFYDEDVSDGVVVRHGVRDDIIVDLIPNTTEEMTTFQKGLVIALLATAISGDDRKQLEELLDWNTIGYDATRTNARKGLIEASQETWKHRDYLPNSLFLFNQNSKKIDTVLNRIIGDRISSYNRQEKKRLTTVLNEGKKQGWTIDRIAREVKRGAGLNSIQQKSLYNRENAMLLKGFSPAEIKKASDAYINTALNYRAELTARWEASTLINEGQIQLWDQLVEEEEINGELSKKRWTTILDNVTGTSDRAMNGQTVGLKEKFIDPLGTYAPLLRPPLRGNCRCDMELLAVEIK